MSEFNLYQHIKNSINENHHLIAQYGFSEFREKQLAYEFHFTSSNVKGDFINIHFEATSSTDIWVKINHYYLEKIWKDKLLDKLQSQLNALYDNDFNAYLASNDTKYLEKNAENYRLFGKELNDKKIHRVFQILGENLSLLISKSNELKTLVEEPIPCSRSITDLKSFMQTDRFTTDFKAYDLLIIETDKCEIEIRYMEDLNDTLTTLTEKKDVNIEWEFRNDND